MMRGFLTTYWKINVNASSRDKYLLSRDAIYTYAGSECFCWLISMVFLSDSEKKSLFIAIFSLQNLLRSIQIWRWKLMMQMRMVVDQESIVIHDGYWDIFNHDLYI